MMSIQRRLTRTLIVVVPTLAAISGVVIYYTCRARLEAEFNQALIAQARAIGDSLMREGTGELEFYFDEESQPEFRKVDEGSFFELWRADGTVFRKSASLGNRNLTKIMSDGAAPAVQATTLEGETHLRAAALKVVPHLDLDDNPPLAKRPTVANEPLNLVVVRNAAPLNKTLATIWNALFWSGAALMLTIVGTVALIVRRGLEPLRKLAAEVASVNADSLDHRISQDSLPEELSTLSQRFNELLARLEGAFTRERSFASAAAHELRTPIAELRSLAEVAVRWPEDVDAHRGFQDSLQIAQRMERLIAALLSIVRTEAQTTPIQESDVDLNSLIPQLWLSYEDAALARGLTFSFRSTKHSSARSEPSLLRALLDNLFSNAAAHTPVGGNIVCELLEGGDQLQFSLSNTCNDLNADDLPRMFEPFWRKDESRTGGKHFGLGLAMVATYATALRLPVRMKLEPEAFKVTLGPMPLSMTPAPMTQTATG